MACGSISLFAVSSKKKILWKLWLWFSKKFHLRVFSDWISKFPFWRQILDIYRQPLLNVLNEVKNNKLGNCCSFCILLSTCWPDFICERQSLENNPGVLPDTPIMHRFCHPKLCTTYCFWFHQGITVVLREINKRQCLCEILGDKTEVYYGRCANTERSPVVARWNPSEGGDRGGLQTRVALAIFGSCSLGPGSALGKKQKKIGVSGCAKKEGERSEPRGSLGRSLETCLWCRSSMTPDSGIMLWLVKCLHVDRFAVLLTVSLFQYHAPTIREKIF